MIGFLSGQIKFKDSGSLILLAGPVGYRLLVPDFVWRRAEPGEKKDFFVYTHVRENEISLFGFEDEADKAIFIKLLSVSGVGPKSALAILSRAQGSARIIRAVQSADVDFFTEVKGLGKKSAQRVIIDLKSKLGSLKDLDLESKEDPDLVSALQGLGFSPPEIKQALKGLDQKLPLEEKLKIALRQAKEEVHARR